MRCVFKYKLVIDHPDEQGCFSVKMPEGAKVLHVGSQGSIHPMLWALVDDEQAMVAHRFRVYGTGHPCPADTSDYLGSAQCLEFVWHVFRV